MYKLIIILLVFLLLLSGCGYIHKQPMCNAAIELPLPPEPVLPTVDEAELMCLSDSAYKRLVRRDIARKYHAELLRALLEARQGGE